MPATAEGLRALLAASGRWPRPAEVRRAFGNRGVVRHVYEIAGLSPAGLSRLAIDLGDVARGNVLHVDVRPLDRRRVAAVVYARTANDAHGAAAGSLAQALRGRRLAFVSGHEVPMTALASAPAPKHFFLMYVVGLGCSWNQKYVKRVQRKLRDRYGIPVRVVCDPSLTSTVAAIGKTVCAMRPSQNTAVVKEVGAFATHYAAVGFDVILVGHSYGGAVVSAFAESLKQPAPRIHMVTFGSIYVPPPQRTPFAEITHFMTDGDISLKCNGLHRDRDAFVRWRPMPDPVKPVRKLSLRRRMEIHNDYPIDLAVDLVTQKPR